MSCRCEVRRLTQTLTDCGSWCTVAHARRADLKTSFSSQGRPSVHVTLVNCKTLKRFTLHPLALHSNTKSTSLRSILTTLQLLREDYSLIFLLPSIARYSFIQLSELGIMERTKMPKLQKGDSSPGSLDCESGILPLSYCGPFVSPSV